MKFKITCLILFYLFLFFSVSAQIKRPMTFEDMIGFERISDPQLSPDGKSILFTITKMNLEANKGTSSIYLLQLDNGEISRLISDQKSCYNARWSNDGKKIAYISSREGTPQIWIYDIETKSEKKITNTSSGVSSPIWSPDGKYILFTAEVFPECPDENCNKERDKLLEDSKVKAKIFTTIPFRVFNSWKDNKRNHLFLINSDGTYVRDITSGDYDSPPIDVGGKIDYAFSPDGREICYVKNTDPLIAISTNNDLYIYNIKENKSKKITENKANDNQPVYSPDGKYLAFRAMKRPGFEADKYDLIIYNRENGIIKNITEDIDKSIDEVIWAPDSKFLYFISHEELHSNLYRINLESKLEKIIEKEFVSDIQVDLNNKNILCLNQNIRKPAEIFMINPDNKKIYQITNINDQKLSDLELPDLEEFWFNGADDKKVQGFLIKPPGFNPKNKYPMIYVIHGGPQGAWYDSWHYRWNMQLFASPGYVVVAVNPRGSTGYGQKFCDEISGDWGGKAYKDLMNGLEYVLKTYTFIDKNKLAAAGGSYGGYMINWLLGHTDKFKCFISHAGVFNLTSMYGSTEELWFVEWDMKGTPWNNPKLYEKYSPSTYVKNFKTPTLVIHGEQDFRVPISEGLQLFTSLQRQGVKSKFLYYPDEGHFILKPQNSQLWYNTIFDWWRQWLK